MSDRIKIKSLRARARPGLKPHRMTLPADTVAALLDLAEAAAGVADTPVGGKSFARLRELLPRFDFGEQR